MICRRLLVVAVCGALGAAVARADDAPAPRPALFQPPRRPPVPAVRDGGWCRTPIDRFVLARLESAGLAPNAPADPLRLLRRVTFDLTGLPPTAAEIEEFSQAHRRPSLGLGAYERLVDRLLASPAYGERWAQHWLDVVRYAETDGFKADEERPAAHRYRDWVIRALNDDLPYDRFVRLQLAGDELEPDDPAARVATGFNRLGTYEYNAANLEQRFQDTLDDLTDVTGVAFLGLTLGCARCHDHKFDPLSQEDYFRLQAFFAATRPRDDLPAAAAAAVREHRRRLAAWEAATAPVRAEIDALLARKRQEQRQYALTKFREEIQQAVLTPSERRTPYQQQIALLAERQLAQAEREAPAKLPADQKKRYQELEQKLAEAGPRPELPAAMAVSDLGPEAPPTYRLLGGDWRKPRERLEPGFPEVFGPATPDTRLPPGVVGTGRRSALARWLTRPDHPLTARVIVNRLWQHHFGVGLVATPNDFGAQGEPATHPELLDWLAVELVESGWSLKHLHRLIVTSAVYRQDSRVDPTEPRHARALKTDPDNKLLWHARGRRLEGEALRDALLAISGGLNRRMYGPSARPELPAKISTYAWKPDPRPEDRDRRSVYVFAKRNLRYPLFAAFDGPDLHNSCGRRLPTTTAPQALLLLNGDLALDRARRLAETLAVAHGNDDAALAAHAIRLAWGRPTDAEELSLAVRFLAGRAATRSRAEAVFDFCHALVNTNEFLYLD